MILLPRRHEGQQNMKLGGYERTWAFIMCAKRVGGFIEVILFLIGCALRFSELISEFSDGFSHFFYLVNMNQGDIHQSCGWHTKAPLVSAWWVGKAIPLLMGPLKYNELVMQFLAGFLEICHPLIQWTCVWKTRARMQINTLGPSSMSSTSVCCISYIQVCKYQQSALW